MTDNTKMVDLPWHDGTTRTVPEETLYESRVGGVLFARQGGYSSYRRAVSSFIHGHVHNSAAVRILTEAPEPPVKVDVPTGIGAVVSMAMLPNLPGFILMEAGWLGLRSHAKYEPSEIAAQLRAGARVLFEGVDESLDE